MLRDTHKLYMGVSHIVTVPCKLPCRLRVIHKAIHFRIIGLFPGAKVTLVNRHRLCECRLCGTFRHPFLICPAEVINICCFRCRARAELCRKAVRICLIEDISLLGGDCIFVDLVKPHALNKALIDPAVLQRKHIVCRRIPVIPVTNQRNSLGMRCPYRKVHSLFSIQYSRMGTHLLINLIISALSKKVSVKLRQKNRIQLLYRCFFCRRLTRRAI